MENAPIASVEDVFLHLETDALRKDGEKKENQSPSSTSPHHKKLLRSRSYPLITTNTSCRELIGSTCIHCLLSKTDAENEKISVTLCTKKCSGNLCLQSCPKHRTDSEPDLRGVVLLENQPPQEPDPTLPDSEPSVSADMGEVLFLQGGADYRECQVCLSVTLTRSRPCCQLPVCGDCLQMYVREKVGRRVLSIRCPNPACCSCICREEILHHLSSDLYQKFLQFLAEDNSDPDRKTCPRCNHVATIGQDVSIRKHRTRANTYKVHCACGMVWCFPCHAPWHQNLSCKQYQRGDQQLREWAKEQHYGQPNANKCPKCKVYIQRSSGCDNMTCSQCHTSFCYRCGGRFYRVKFFGNHFSRLSVFGCKYRFKPHEPVKRKMIRGTLFACQLAAVPVGVTLVVGVGSVVAVVLAPVYVMVLGCRAYKRMRQERRRRSNCKIERQWRNMSATLYANCDRRCDLQPRPAAMVDFPTLHCPSMTPVQ